MPTAGWNMPLLPESEKFLREALSYSGWEVLKEGLPDFLCLKGKRVKFIEVKGDYDVLLPSQKRTIGILQNFGFEVEVVDVRLTRMNGIGLAVVVEERNSGKKASLQVNPGESISQRMAQLISEW